MEYNLENAVTLIDAYGERRLLPMEDCFSVEVRPL